MGTRLRAAHRWIGLVLVVPLVAWGATGLLFHLKPGWSRAYEMLAVERSEPLRAPVLGPSELAPEVEILAARYRMTVLGPVAEITRDDGSRMIVRADTGKSLAPLDGDQARLLAEDAIGRSADPGRYGVIRGVDVGDDEVTMRTTTGVRVVVDRHRLGLRQSGEDTRRIDWLYRVHYLQWTGIEGVDRIFASLGIAFLWVLAGLGVWLALPRRSTATAAEPRDGSC